MSQIIENRTPFVEIFRVLPNDESTLYCSNISYPILGDISSSIVITFPDTSFQIVDSTAIVTLNKVSSTARVLSYPVAYEAFASPTKDQISLDCFVDPCTDGPSLTPCYLSEPYADGVKEFIASVTLSINPVVSWYQCDSAYTIEISPIVSDITNKIMSCNATFAPLSIPIGLNNTCTSLATLLYIGSPDSDSSGSQDYAYYANVIFTLLNKNDNPSTVKKACKLSVSPFDCSGSAACFDVYFGITRLCGTVSFVFISPIIFFKFFSWGIPIYIVTIPRNRVIFPLPVC